MKKITFVIFLSLTFTWANAQVNIKPFRFYATYNFGEKLQVNPRLNNTLSEEINNLNSKVGGMNIGVIYDFYEKNNTTLGIGLSYSFLGNSIKSSTLPNSTNTYTYRFESSSIEVPIEIRHYYNPMSAIQWFISGAVVPNILVSNSLTKKENIFDASQKYVSSNSIKIENVNFYNVNGSLRIGIGVEIKTKRGASISVLPTYSFQIRPTWGQEIKQHINLWGVTVGTRFRSK